MQLPIVAVGPVVTVLGSVLELATILMEWVAPTISPGIVILVSVCPASTELLIPPSCC